MNDTRKPQTTFEKFREQVTTFSEGLSKFFKRNISKIYIGIFTFSLVFYGLVYASTFFTPKVLNGNGNYVGDIKQLTSTQAVILKSRSYNEKTGLLAIQVALSDDNASGQLVTPTLTFKNVLQDETSSKVEVTTIQIDRLNYMVYVSGLKSWLAERLDISSPELNVTNSNGFITKNDSTLEKDNQLVMKSSKELIAQNLELKIVAKQKEKASLQEQVLNLEQDNLKYQTEIQKIQDEMTRQIESEKAKSQQRIETLQKAIEKNKKESQDIPKQVDKVNSEITELQTQLSKVN